MKNAPLFKPKKSGAKSFSKRRENPYLDPRWIKFRARFLKHNPQCYVCHEKSTTVDHLVPWKVDPGLLFLEKPDNFIPLCDRHHNFCTASFDRFSIPKTGEKLKWLAEERERNGISIKVKVIPIRKRN